jgi:UMF1 family MFS transporter
VLFGIAVAGPAAGAPGALFASTAERIFLLFGIMIGIFGGPMQAAARSMMARLAPKPLLGQFFGLYALTGEATAFFVPLLVGAMTNGFHSQRVGLVPIVVVLAAGFVLMIGVREARAEMAD